MRLSIRESKWIHRLHSSKVIMPMKPKAALLRVADLKWERGVIEIENG